VIERTGYVPNLLAGGLASRRTGSCRDRTPISNQVFSESIQSLTDRLWESGYQVLLGTSGYPTSREESLLAAIISRRPDGIFLTGISHSAKAAVASSRRISRSWKCGTSLRARSHARRFSMKKSDSGGRVPRRQGTGVRRDIGRRCARECARMGFLSVLEKTGSTTCGPCTFRRRQISDWAGKASLGLLERGSFRGRSSAVRTRLPTDADRGAGARFVRSGGSGHRRSPTSTSRRTPSPRVDVRIDRPPSAGEPRGPFGRIEAGPWKGSSTSGFT